ncbi:MAG: hypothetical protein EPO11_08080 [Gammaproteobacteria bacterium]|nr:MAG: hypothetical protein EPO11_08080 [Gammaproteobacteria bacterium]
MPALLIVLAYFLQTHLLLSGDVGYLLYVTNQFLEGGTYTKDFFETNPPMILYLYTPACLLAKFTGISIITAVRIYISVLILLSFYLCMTLLKRIIQPQDKFLFTLLRYMVLFILLFLPAYHFGQREHLLMILILPYLLSCVLLKEKKNLPAHTAFLIGFLAGCGFALKPFFLVTLGLVELYVSNWIRIESLVIACVLILYLGSIFIFQPNYIYILLPLISDLYFIGPAQPWLVLLTTPTVCLCFFAIFVYLFCYQQDRYRPLSMIFLLALLGMIVAFLLPQTAWYYHVLPALSLSCLLMTLCFGQALMTRRLFLVSASLFILFIPFNIVYEMYADSMAYKIQGPTPKLISYINSLPTPHSVFCFSYHTTEDCFPLVYATHSTYSGRYPFFWWLRGLIKQKDSATIQKEKAYLMTVLEEDLTKNKHNIIIIGPGFDFIRYFSQDEKFREAWQHYSYLTTIDSFQVYAYD